MEKNELKKVGGLVLMVMAALLLLHWLPATEVGGHALRRVDILADVRPPLVFADEPDTLEVQLPVAKPAFADTCPSGKVCIEDYSDSTCRGMSAFYEALDELAQRPRPVRIAYFGDSFIEADILTADLRAMLQQKYGGCGVGFVPITSPINGFRPTVVHTFGGWNSHAATDSVGFERSRQGISGHYFFPYDGAYVELRGQRKYASRLDTCQQVSVFFRNTGTMDLSLKINGATALSQSFGPEEQIRKWSVEGRIGTARWTVNAADSAVFYGVAMDDLSGIVLDNFSLRGMSGLSLRFIPLQTLKEFNALRPYDLIVLQYGLNVATERGRDYNYYVEGMTTALKHLKEAFPQAAILIVSVGDRDYKTEEGDLRTMPGIRNLVRYQQRLAADNGVAFWNLFEAMGGNESMVKLVEANPAQANYDYTHINFRGGKYLAGLLYEALVYGKEQYDRRRAYESEP